MVNLQNANTIWVYNFWAKNFFLILRICMLDCWILSERNNDPSSELMDLDGDSVEVGWWSHGFWGRRPGAPAASPLKHASPKESRLLASNCRGCWVAVKKKEGIQHISSTIMGQCPWEKRSNKPLDGLGVASVKNGRQRFLDVICSKLYSTQYMYTKYAYVYI
jgi:hypothetical protein